MARIAGSHSAGSRPACVMVTSMDSGVHWRSRFSAIHCNHPVSSGRKAAASRGLGAAGMVGGFMASASIAPAVCRNASDCYPVNSATLPPAAVVLMVRVCSAQKRCR